MHRGVARSPRDRGFRAVTVNPRQCRDLPPARRRAGEDRQGRRGGARGPQCRVPGHGGNGAGGRDRRQAPRHAGASGGARRPARGTGAVPAGVGEADPDGPAGGSYEPPSRQALSS